MAKAKQTKEAKGAEAAAKTPLEPIKPPRLFERYKKDAVPALMKRFQYKSVMQVPHLEKISVNVGVGSATQDPKILETATKELEQVVGQKVVITRAKKSISNFKLREGVPIGCRVTLRKARMYEFFDRFVSVAVPRIRDFRGFSEKSFDGRGNFTVGIKEQIIFPEIDVDKVTRITGMDITFVTTAGTDEEAYELLKVLGMPFVRRTEIIETPSDKPATAERGA
ncbi:MAG: 50S ribosomal protein L5 [Bacteroidota bacterium]